MSIVERIMIFVMVSWGATNIVSGSKILRLVRDWLEDVIPLLGGMVKCYMCTGFWIGWIWSSLGFGVCNQMRLWEFKSHSAMMPIGVFSDALIASGAVWALYVVFEKFGAGDL